MTDESTTDTDQTQKLDAHRISQREKQLKLGRDTPGYLIYLRFVPKENRIPGNVNHPVTPRVDKECSKRQWDAEVKAWRRALHRWDEATAEHPFPCPKREDSPTLQRSENSEADIRGNYQTNGAHGSPVSRPVSSGKHVSTPPPRQCKSQCELINGGQNKCKSVPATPQRSDTLPFDHAPKYTSGFHAKYPSNDHYSSMFVHGGLAYSHAGGFFQPICGNSNDDFSRQQHCFPPVSLSSPYQGAPFPVPAGMESTFLMPMSQCPVAIPGNAAANRLSTNVQYQPMPSFQSPQRSSSVMQQGSYSSASTNRILPTTKPMSSRDVPVGFYTPQKPLSDGTFLNSSGGSVSSIPSTGCYNENSFMHGDEDWVQYLKARQSNFNLHNGLSNSVPRVSKSRLRNITPTSSANATTNTTTSSASMWGDSTSHRGAPLSGCLLAPTVKRKLLDEFDAMESKFEIRLPATSSNGNGNDFATSTTSASASAAYFNNSISNSSGSFGGSGRYEALHTLSTSSSAMDRSALDAGNILSELCSFACSENKETNEDKDHDAAFSSPPPTSLWSLLQLDALSCSNSGSYVNTTNSLSTSSEILPCHSLLATLNFPPEETNSLSELGDFNTEPLVASLMDDLQSVYTSVDATTNVSTTTSNCKTSASAASHSAMETSSTANFFSLFSLPITSTVPLEAKNPVGKHPISARNQATAAVGKQETAILRVAEQMLRQENYNTKITTISFVEMLLYSQAECAAINDTLLGFVPVTTLLSLAQVNKGLCYVVAPYLRELNRVIEAFTSTKELSGGYHRCFAQRDSNTCPVCCKNQIKACDITATIHVKSWDELKRIIFRTLPTSSADSTTNVDGSNAVFNCALRIFSHAERCCGLRLAGDIVATLVVLRNTSLPATAAAAETALVQNGSTVERRMLVEARFATAKCEEWKPNGQVDQIFPGNSRHYFSFQYVVSA